MWKAKVPPPLLFCDWHRNAFCSLSAAAVLCCEGEREREKSFKWFPWWHGMVEDQAGALEEREREVFGFWIGAKEKLSRTCRDDDTGVKENGKFTNIRSSSWFRPNKRGSPHSHHRAPPFVRSFVQQRDRVFRSIIGRLSKTPTRVLSVSAAWKHQWEYNAFLFVKEEAQQQQQEFVPFTFALFLLRLFLSTAHRGNAHVHCCPQDKTRQFSITQK